MPHMEVSSLVVLLLQIAAVVLVSRCLGLVMRRIGQPLVIAEILGGILLGPSLLGWLWPSAMTLLFPANSLPVLTLLSQVGLVLFMFLVGLELDPALLSGRTRASVAISQTSIILPFVLGVIAGGWLYGKYAPDGVSRLSFSLFLGVAMSITAFPVLARILKEGNLFSSKVGAIAIACAAVDDVTAWCILALVVAISKSQDAALALWTTGLAVLFIAAMICYVRPLLRHFGARILAQGGLTPGWIAGALLLLIASSTVTELIGIHALFGAFLCGAIFPKEGGLAQALAQRIESVAVVLLLPLFFAFSGLRTEIGLITEAHDWLALVTLILLATAGKFGGSALAARVTGLRWREASAVGILMNTRGLMELIALNIGRDLGVISPTLFTMLVIMALVTTFATSPILRRVYPLSEFVRGEHGCARIESEPQLTKYAPHQ